MYTASPVTNATTPLWQVVRDATQHTVLVTTKDRAQAAAGVLTLSLVFRIDCLRASGYELAANVVTDPKLHNTHELRWLGSRVAGVERHVARLDNLWTAEVRQDGEDGMFELTIVRPSGVPLGKPVLDMSLELAKVQAVGLYLRRVLPEFDKSFSR